MKNLSLLLFVFALVPAGAQDSPGPDVFLLTFAEADGQITLGPPQNLTSRPGYDNQPSFTPDSRSVLFTAQHGEQTDIYRYDLATGQTAQLTDTPTSEYSPLATPAGNRFSVIQVEADGTQRLWAFPLGGGAPALVLPDVAPVGYHAWRDAETLALFVLGEPHALWLANPTTQAGQRVIGEIGRSLHRRPGSAFFSFIHKAREGEWWIKQVDPATLAVLPLVQTRPGREDFCWTPNGTALMTDGTALWHWTPGTDRWQRVADWADAGLANLTRCAVSPDGQHLALVAEPHGTD